MNDAAQVVGGQEWDGVVSGALASSGIDGTVMLGGSGQPIEVPFGLQALISALLHFAAPKAPRKLRVYTYELLAHGALLEIRGARPLSALPGGLLELISEMGVTLNFNPQAQSSSLLLTLPAGN